MYDAARADRVVDFFKQLKHTKGEWAGVPFVLEPWQEDEIIRPLFGTVNEDGLRQYRTAYLSTARKNGKSELAAGLALYLLYADQEPGAEVYSAAYTREQAGQVFKVASTMVEANPTLNYWGQVHKTGKVIDLPVTGSFYKAIASEVRGTWGFNAHGILFDELHAQKTRDLWDALTTSTGTRRQPMVVAITTAGVGQTSICHEIYQYAKRVQAGEVDDLTFFPYIREAPAEADWRDPKSWFMANPGLGVFKKLDTVATECKQALEMPSKENSFRQLDLNQWVEQVTRWLPIHIWDEQRRPIAWKRLRGKSCYAGLDLASSTDLAAFVMVFPPEKKNGLWTVRPHFWMPGKNLDAKKRRDKVPYDVWARNGLIHATEGEVIDYKAVRADIEGFGQEYQIEEVAFDRWGAVQLSHDLEDDGLTMVPMGQGFASMSGPCKDLETLYTLRKFAHDGNPVLRWNLGNTAAERDSAGNVKPSKKASTARIDGTVGLIMALSRAVLFQPSVYDSKEGMLVL